MATTYANPLYFNADHFEVFHCADHSLSNIMSPHRPHNGPADEWLDSNEQKGLSLFAQTMLEQDREFYRQFPDAKRAQIEQWNQQRALQNTCSDVPSLEYYVDGSAVLHYVEPVDSYVPLDSMSGPLVHAAPEPLQDRLHYEYVQLAEEASRTIAGLSHHGWAGQQFEHVHSPPESPQPTTPPSPVLEVEAHQLVPSNHREHARSLSHPEPAPVKRRGRRRPRSIGNIPSLATPKTPLSATSSTMVPPPNITFINNNSVQLTGHWSTDAQVAECFLHAPAPRHAQVPDIIATDSPVVNAPSTRRHHLTHRLRKAVRAQSHPYSRGSSPSSPSSRKSSPAPRKGRSKAVKPKSSSDGPKKPLLACLFCRGRKIACGAPPPGSTDHTCDQCLKRDLDCEYPLESHRGLRKKKPEPETDLNAVIIHAAGLDHDDLDADAEGEDDEFQE